MSFCACGKFPVVAVAFIPEGANMGRIHLYINGCYAGFLDNYFVATREDVCLLDLRCLEWEDKWPIPAAFQVPGWNHVEVTRYSSNDVNRESMVGYCGVYVYKQETNIEDIPFTCPDSLKRTLSIVDNNPPKRKRGEEAPA